MARYKVEVKMISPLIQSINLARNINSLLLDKSKYDSFKKASYKSFIERFQEDDMVNNINNLYLD